MRKPSLFMRWVAILVLIAPFAIVFLAAQGCGRSDLLLGSLDGGTAATTCSAKTCPNGCCDALGVCRVGTDLQACGNFGAQCTDCVGKGQDVCDTETKSCGKRLSTCDGTTCPDGCCNGTLCLTGDQIAACGTSGKSCFNCALEGRSCDALARTCSMDRCATDTCEGCCVGSNCVEGESAAACGAGGKTCLDCAATGQTCAMNRCEGTASCGPANCGGCCIGDRCVQGADDTACGKAGLACSDCSGRNQVCAALGSANERTCTPRAACDATNCAGCCQGNVCVPMPTAAACGGSGGQCRACGAGEQCNAGTCVAAPMCGPGTCAGCCLPDGSCSVGTADGICGAGGAACRSCSATGSVCRGGACQALPCGPGTCAGCCQAGMCVLGNADGACGLGGGACTNCGATGQACGMAGMCQATCNAANCAGCCVGTQCNLGFLNTRCGSGGGVCANCTAQGGTCNIGANPRTCNVPAMNCPGAYGGCGAAVATPEFARHTNVCNATDLQNGRVACAGGPESAGCVAYFAALGAIKPACQRCLLPFDESFQELTGVFRCLSPFVDAACDHNTGCATECETATCNMCPVDQMATCFGTVQGGTCRAHFTASTCVLGGLLGGGAFCSPANPAYRGNFGFWLEGVGREYCGP